MQLYYLEQKCIFPAFKMKPMTRFLLYCFFYNFICLAHNPHQVRYWPLVLPSAFLPSVKTTKQLPPFHIPPLQSPINIRASRALTRVLPDLRFVNLLSGSVLLEMKNTGRTVEFEIADNSVSRPLLIGGPLSKLGEFAFHDLHVHWGHRDILGGEHKVNSRRFAIEGHCVHFNLKYRTMEEAAKQSDGLAVVAFFLKAGRRNNPYFEELISVLPNITLPKSSLRVRARDSLGWFADLGQPKHYFTYPGSLTTPPYSENVVWILYPDPVYISSRQVESFRKLLSINLTVLKQNIRPVQPFNNRPLIYAI